ncbi:MAG: glycoside hydrolase family 65 protein [Saprospirales bacterium]|nr:MAG: glycoside hydrolase family 65 protein [Saprospirales bacterium]
MKNYFELHEWKVIERGYNADFNRAAESVCSIGNGRMGQRANFEEHFSGDSLQGSYIAGVYFPDKTRVGWWKNGYPEYYAKVINSVNWIGIRVAINGVELDLNTCKIYDFVRELDMEKSLLTREFTAKLAGGEKIKVVARRFYSIKRLDMGLIDYSIEALNFSGEISLTPYLDFDVVNEDSNYEEKFWEETSKDQDVDFPFVEARTKKLDFRVRATMGYRIFKDGQELKATFLPSGRKKYVAHQLNIPVSEGQVLRIEKFASVVSNFYYPVDDFEGISRKQLKEARDLGFQKILDEHTTLWREKWDRHDIVIEGDLAAQQGIRFNIFHLYQTYTGDDPRLNIGPKGFTGEKYGGSTYWDTEAYCLPFYLSSAEQQVARNLLEYRYNHLEKAIENAKKLGFSKGAALYPMVTMNGEECHNEWEITFEEIHRNAAIAYAIFDYIRYTGDYSYLHEYGLEVLIAISRFWAQRVNFSEAKKQYVMLGVTGPNEYENNVNNNWYTNYAAIWCFRYTIEALEYVKSRKKDDYDRILEKTAFDEEAEIARWDEISKNMYYPRNEELNIYLQQEGFLDKEIIPAAELPADQRPINQNWSWDRILRSCYIKQADVLQGIYFFEHEFSEEQIRDHFNYYEPLTVHESSLSPCVHVILAAAIGELEKAYELYLRTSRLDLDDYNKEVAEGLHITSMAGTWMSVVKGFGGMRIKNDAIHLDPLIPEHWKECNFNVFFRGANIKVSINHSTVEVCNNAEEEAKVVLFDREYLLKKGEKAELSYPVK